MGVGTYLDDPLETAVQSVDLGQNLFQGLRSIVRPWLHVHGFSSDTTVYHPSSRPDILQEVQREEWKGRRSIPLLSRRRGRRVAVRIRWAGGTRRLGFLPRPLEMVMRTALKAEKDKGTGTSRILIAEYPV